jgi:class 3 adenylate cyclase
MPDAQRVEIAGSDYWGVFLSPEIVDEIERFVGSLGVERQPESVLATLLFTDLVDSTRLANELGDRGWALLVERHHAGVREQLRRFRGIEVDTAGDGFFATFGRAGARDPLWLCHPRRAGGARPRRAHRHPYGRVCAGRREAFGNRGQHRRAWRRPPRPEKSSSPRLSRISSPARESRSRSAASAS